MLEWLLVTCLASGLILVIVYQARLKPTLVALASPTRTLTQTPLPTLSAPTTAVFTVTPSLSPTATLVQPSPTSTLSPTPWNSRGRIVYTCTPEQYNQLCIMDADGSNQTRLTSRKANDYYPTLSPDGKSVVFVSNQTGRFDIFLLDLISGAEFQITDGIGNVTAPQISPDGQWVVFASKQMDDSSIWLIRPDGSLPKMLTDDQWNEIDPAWSPDGSRSQIAFAAVRGGYVELFVMAPDGTNIQQVTHDVPRIGGRNAWSPDGTRLAFYAGPRGDRDIYVVEIASGQVTRLTQGGNNTAPSFSPDGNWIAFSSSRDGDHEIYVMRNDGSEVTQLTDNTYDDWQPRWGP